MKRFWWLGLVVVLAGCGQKQEAGKEESAKPEAAQEGDSKSVEISPEGAQDAEIETAPVRSMRMQSELAVTGTITNTAKGKAIVTPPVGGKIVRLFVGPGDTVKQGQALAVIESPDIAQANAGVADADRQRLSAEADLRKAGAELELAKARLRTAQSQLERQYALAKAGAFSQPSLQAAQSELNDAQSDLQSAKEDEAIHKLQLERAERLYKQELISRTELEQARLAASQDEIKRQRAEQRVAQATTTLKREQDIANRGLLNAREVQAAEAEARAARLDVGRAKIGVDAAKAALSSANKGLASARASYSATKGSGNTSAGNSVTLKAPLSGVVTERSATIGQAVERSSELFEIENLATVWVTAQVREKDVASISLGGTVRLTTAAYPGHSFSGVIQVVGTHLDPKTRTMPVECLVQNPSGLLRENMFADIRIGIGKATTAVAVPDSAIDRQGEELAVFVAEGGKFEKRSVKIGRSAEGFTEILSGVKPGDKVVTKGLFVVESETRKSELKGDED